MEIKRVWAMPNNETFSIKPIGEIILKHKQGIGNNIIDPFARKSKIANITNDLDLEQPTDYHMDAIDFLKIFADGSVDMVLYDPPYSPRQVSECYKKMGKTVNMQTTQSSYWANQKKEITRIVRVGGKVVTCGWNSGGMGIKAGFRIVEILLVAHGGWHNDTIVTVEIKE